MRTLQFHSHGTNQSHVDAPSNLLIDPIELTQVSWLFCGSEIPFLDVFEGYLGNWVRNQMTAVTKFVSVQGGAV
jgi:hypothetical protein